MSDELHEKVALIISATRKAYESRASEYAAATSGYDAYPGLKDELLAFEKEIPSGLPILDLGCGGGRDSRLLAGLGRRVVAGDVCGGMLTTARRLSAAQRDAIRYVGLEMRDIPFADASFGGVWASGSLLHLPAMTFPQVLSEVRRVLAPAGIAAISMRAGDGEGWRDGGTLEGRRWFSFVPPDGFVAAMIRAGFDDVSFTITGRRNWYIAIGHRGKTG